MAKPKPDQTIRHEFALNKPTQELLDTAVTAYSIGNVTSGLAALLSSPLGVGLSLITFVRYFFPNLFQTAPLTENEEGENIDLSLFSTEKEVADFIETRNLASIASIGLAIWALTPAGRLANIGAAIGGLAGGTAFAEASEDLQAYYARKAANNQAQLLWALETQNRASQYQSTSSFGSPAEAYM